MTLLLKTISLSVSLLHITLQIRYFDFFFRVKSDFLPDRSTYFGVPATLAAEFRSAASDLLLILTYCRYNLVHFVILSMHVYPRRR